MTRKFNTLFIALVALIAIGASKTELNPFEFSSRDNVSAMGRYYAAESKAYDAYLKAEAAIRKQLSRDLQSSLDKLTKAGQLEEALRVKNAVASLEKEMPPLPAGARTEQKKTQDILGVWKVTYSNGFVGSSFIFEDNGVCTYEGSDGPKGRWKLAGDQIYIEFSGIQKIWTLEPDGAITGENTRGKQHRMTRKN